MVRGLGRARSLEGEPVLASGEFQWQWIKLEFGQTLLIKSRTRLPELEEERVPVEQRASAAVNETADIAACSPAAPTPGRSDRQEAARGA